MPRKGVHLFNVHGSWVQELSRATGQQFQSAELPRLVRIWLSLMEANRKWLRLEA